MRADCSSKAVAVTVDWLVEAMDEISMTIRKEWIALILLPAISSVAGMRLFIISFLRLILPMLSKNVSQQLRYP